jgi:hypothetical protein
MGSDGRVKIFDFGALTGFGYSPRVVGTPPGIAPEAFAGASLDQRTDLYSLGALAYWLLTGRHAYPARHIADLPACWAVTPRRPSSLVSDIPKELDALVLALLHADPLARPGSAAEVIERLNVLADLPPEDAVETERLAGAFLGNPRFTGRNAELALVDALLAQAQKGWGGAVCIQAMTGMGRSRLLDEIGVRAQLAGATVVRADAAAHRQPRGVMTALALRVLDVIAGPALKDVARYASTLTALGSDVEARLGVVKRPASTAAEKDAPASDVEAGRADEKGTAEVAGAAEIDGAPPTSLDQWLGEISRTKTLLIEVDNVEFADADSLAMLIALARLARERPLVLVVTERVNSAGQTEMGLRMLESHATPIELGGLSPPDMLAFARSLFGDAPNVERLAIWLAERTAGSPLHAIEICRQLARQQVIRFQGGLWTLPMERPDTELPAALGSAFTSRIASLSDGARALAECLSLHREPPTLELCRRLAGPGADRDILDTLDELAVADILYADREGYRFSSTALCEALLAGMDAERLERNHRRLGEELAARAGVDAPILRIEAGWHLIQGGDGHRGAEMIAAVTHDAVTTRTLMANGFRAGQPLEAALKVYRRERRTPHERMPLLAALAQAGYYEGRSWGERYGDEALDLLEELSGLRTARVLRRVLGRFLAIVIGVFVAFVRFHLTPRGERKYPFSVVLLQLFSVATTLTAVASLTLDPERASCVAASLEPFAVLPERLTPVGIYQFCRGLSLISGDYVAEAYELFGTLIQRLGDPRYYPTMPADARKLYLAGAHFARGSCAMFRVDGGSTLETADALDALGIKLYSMIASQLRVLYYTLRGELALAAPYHEQIEQHAAHVGSAWQVETWAILALVLLYSGPLRDVVGATRALHRLDLLTRTVPELRRSRRFAKDSLMFARGETLILTGVAEAYYAEGAPRSHRGWGARQALLAQAYNELGHHVQAKAVCERAVSHMTDADRDFVMLFLLVDRELAIADAALGRVDQALARLDGLLARFAPYDHPLALGLLHEARGQIAWRAGDKDAYERSLSEVERRFRPTGTPALVEKCERLAGLARRGDGSSGNLGAPDPETMPSMVAAHDTLGRTQTESVKALNAQLPAVPRQMS